MDKKNMKLPEHIHTEEEFNKWLQDLWVKGQPPKKVTIVPGQLKQMGVMDTVTILKMVDKAKDEN